MYSQDDGCEIDGNCYEDGEELDGNELFGCQPEIDRTKWTLVGCMLFNHKAFGPFIMGYTIV